MKYDQVLKSFDQIASRILELPRVLSQSGQELLDVCEELGRLRAVVVDGLNRADAAPYRILRIGEPPTETVRMLEAELAKSIAECESLKAQVREISESRDDILVQRDSAREEAEKAAVDRSYLFQECGKLKAERDQARAVCKEAQDRAERILSRKSSAEDALDTIGILAAPYRRLVNS